MTNYKKIISMTGWVLSLSSKLNDQICAQCAVNNNETIFKNSLSNTCCHLLDWFYCKPKAFKWHFWQQLSFDDIPVKNVLWCLQYFGVFLNSSRFISLLSCFFRKAFKNLLEDQFSRFKYITYLAQLFITFHPIY